MLPKLLMLNGTSTKAEVPCAVIDLDDAETTEISLDNEKPIFTEIYSAVLEQLKSISREEGDKFYIVLEGTVGVYKPIYIEKIMSVNEYYSYMINIKFQENNYLKLRRITEKNAHLNFDLDVLEKLDPDSYYMRKRLKFYVEENDKLGEFGSDFAFGEIALIKRTKRNATIIALQPSKLLSIDKYDYNKIIRELEEKRLEKVLEEFKRNYPLFQYYLFLSNCFFIRIYL